MGSALQRGSERGRRATRFGVLECELGRVAAREGERESRGERRGRGPRPSRKFPRAARFRCPVHIITVLRIPTPEIVRALVALRELLSRFLPVFFTPPLPRIAGEIATPTTHNRRSRRDPHNSGGIR